MQPAGQSRFSYQQSMEISLLVERDNPRWGRHLSWLKINTGACEHYVAECHKSRLAMKQPKFHMAQKLIFFRDFDKF